MNTFAQEPAEMEKAHKHKQLCPLTAWVRGGVSRSGGQGSNVYVLYAEPKNMNTFVRAPGREDR